MKKPAFFFLLLLWCLQLVAQKEVSVAASVDKSVILIGEPLQLTLNATFSNAHAPSFFVIDSLPHFEILGRSKIDTTATTSQTALKQTLTLTSWDSGAWAIPGFVIAGIKKVATKPVVIAVNYTPVSPDKEYNDVKDIIEVEKPPRETWYWYVIGAVLLLLFLSLLFPKKKKEAAAETVIQEGAFKTALKELETLRHKSALDDKAYFTELIQIFRTYLLRSKGIQSLQQTTGDLSQKLQTLALPHGDLKKLVDTLQLSDFVKFAQYQADTAERDGAWNQIKESITAIEPLKQ